MPHEQCGIYHVCYRCKLEFAIYLLNWQLARPVGRPTFELGRNFFSTEYKKHCELFKIKVHKILRRHLLTGKYNNKL